ncbi:hypothetical protein [Salibaculum griseiflavum]|uniref:Uncharacterized protein n=1 Tax=Salibaculum griseiflavum TaxID=1914409 RepID=A0A2V1P6J8_9RHOB|nr:hypothetical protein [Salibaculum griseiflavum]PWG17420.1 hypothetical protein DFK10_06535 [Salibaculum griseiflavum]
MPLLLAILGAVIVFLWWSHRRATAEAAPKPPACIWLATGETRGRLREYRCDSCGVTGYTTGDGPPKTCKKDLKGRG